MAAIPARSSRFRLRFGEFVQKIIRGKEPAKVRLVIESNEPKEGPP
jgi:hypothetical protein